MSERPALRARQAPLAERVSALALAATRLASGAVAGMHRSPFRGGSAEFAEYKEYAPGDDPRTIDWRSVARSDRWFVKRYEETTNRPCHLLLDASQSMAFTRGGRDDKLETARLLLGALATLLLKQGDAVGVTVTGASSSRIPARSRASHLDAVLDALERAEPSRRADLPRAVDDAAAAFTRRGLVILASDLVDDVDAMAGSLRRLRARGHEVVVLQVLDPDEIDFPFAGTLRFRDPETGDEVTADASTVAEGYRAEVTAFLAACDRACSTSGADLVRVTTNGDLAQALVRFLAQREGVVRRATARR